MSGWRSGEDNEEEEEEYVTVRDTSVGGRIVTADSGTHSAFERGRWSHGLCGGSCRGVR